MDTNANNNRESFEDQQVIFVDTHLIQKAVEGLQRAREEFQTLLEQAEGGDASVYYDLGVRYTEGDIARLVSETKLPCVVKPVANGSSVGVSIAHTGAELKAALEECLQFGAQVVLEQYIEGREIQVGIIAGKALPSIEIIPKTGFYDYANKYQAGAAEEICPSPIPEDWEMRVRSATETVYRLIGLSVYSRADFIVTPDGTPYFLEINTLPGMTKTSLLPQEAAAVGIGYEELCEKIVEESLKQKRGL